MAKDEDNGWGWLEAIFNPSKRPKLDMTSVGRELGNFGRDTGKVISDTAKNVGDWGYTVAKPAYDYVDRRQREDKANAAANPPEPTKMDTAVGNFWNDVDKNVGVTAYSNSFLGKTIRNAQDALYNPEPLGYGGFWDPASPVEIEEGWLRNKEAWEARNPGQTYDMPEGVIENADAFRKTDPTIYQDKFTGGGLEGTQELTPAEWAALTPDQQQGVLANFALYQAAEQDRALTGGEADDTYNADVEAIFGEGHGSDTYSPNTIRVLKELGYSNQKSDLDLFLNGQALASYDDLMGKTSAGSDVRMENFNTFAMAEAFDNPAIVESLSYGQNLIGALQGTDVFSEETRQYIGQHDYENQVPVERREGLNVALSFLSDPTTLEQIQANPDLAEQARLNIEDATAGLDPAIVANYFKEVYGRFAGSMPYDQFSAIWLEG